MQSFCDRRPLLLHHCVVQSNVGEFLDKAWPTDAKRESQRRFICRGGITTLHGSMVDICVMNNATCIFTQATIGCRFALVVSYSRDLSILIHGCCLCRSKFMSQRLSKNASLLWFLKSTYTVVSWHGTSID